MNQWIKYPLIDEKLIRKITCVSLDKHFVQHDKGFINWITFLSKILLFENFHNQCARNFVGEHIERFSKSIRQSISWNKFDSNLNRPIVSFQLSQAWSMKDLTCHPPRACLMLALEGFPSSLWILYVSLGCSGNTTRIMRRTLHIYFLAFHGVWNSKHIGNVSYWDLLMISGL